MEAATTSWDKARPQLFVKQGSSTADKAVEYRRRLEKYNKWERHLTKIVVVVGLFFLVTSALLYVAASGSISFFNPRYVNPRYGSAVSSVTNVYQDGTASLKGINVEPPGEAKLVIESDDENDSQDGAEWKEE